MLGDQEIPRCPELLGDLFDALQFCLVEFILDLRFFLRKGKSQTLPRLFFVLHESVELLLLRLAGKDLVHALSTPDEVCSEHVAGR